MKHPVYDSDTQFRIDPITRTIKNAETSKVGVIQFDHNSERVTFELPRIIEGHDMSLCDSVKVHYINIDAITKAQTAGIYEVTDLQVNPNRDDVVVCSWLISQNATQYVGSLNFVIRFACTNPDGTLSYVWSSAIYKGISVGEGIDNGEAVVEIFPDILENWRNEVFNDVKDSLSDEVYDAITQIRDASEELFGDFNGLSNRVEQNSKRIYNLEQGIDPDPFITDDTVAYQKAVPSSALPYAALERLGGMSHKSKNLARTMNVTQFVGVGERVKVQYTDGSAKFTFTGFTGERSSLLTMDYTQVLLSAGTYTISAQVDKSVSSGFSFAFYLRNMDAGTNDFTHEFSTSSICQCTFTVSSDTNFAWGFYLYNASTNTPITDEYTVNVMLAEGSTALPFEPYFEGIRNTPLWDIRTTGANLWDIGSVSFTKTKQLDLPTVLPAGRYAISTNWVTESSEDAVAANIQYTDGTYLGLLKMSRTYTERTFEATKPFSAVMFYSAGSGVTASTGVSCTIYDIMLYASESTATDKIPYQPYFDETIALPDSLISLVSQNGYGMGISNDVNNHFNFISNEYVQMCDERNYQSGDEDNPDVITDGVKTIYPLDTPIVTELHIMVDNFIKVGGGGTLTFVNYHEMAVPSTIVYCVKE